MNTLNKISSTLEKVVDYFLIFAFAAMTIVYFSGIVARYAFNSGITWAEEFTRYMNVALVMLGSATVARYNGHTNISVLEISVKGNAKKAVILIQHIFTIIFFAAASIIGINFAGTATHVSANMRIPMSVMYHVMSFAFILLVFQAIVSIISILKAKGDE